MTRNSPKISKLLLIVACLAIGARAHAAQPSSSPTDPFTRALTQFDQAHRLDPSDPQTKSAYAAAADDFEMALTAPNLTEQSRAELLFDLANAAALAQDWPRAVLNYRRAELLRPALPGLADRLAAARREVAAPPATTSTDEAKESPSQQAVNIALVHDTEPAVLSLLTDWAGSQPRLLWIATIAAAWCLLWAWTMIVIAGRSRARLVPRWPIVASAVVLVVGCAGAWLALGPEFSCKDAVVRESIAIQDTPAPPTATVGTTTLPAGAECRVVEVRSAGLATPWARIEPINPPAPNTTGWVPMSSLEFIVPSAAARLASPPPPAPDHPTSPEKNLPKSKPSTWA